MDGEGREVVVLRRWLVMLVVLRRWLWLRGKVGLSEGGLAG